MSPLGSFGLFDVVRLAFAIGPLVVEKASSDLPRYIVPSGIYITLMTSTLANTISVSSVGWKRAFVLIGAKDCGGAPDQHRLRNPELQGL